MKNSAYTFTLILATAFGLNVILPSSVSAQLDSTDGGMATASDTTRFDFPGRSITVISVPKENIDDPVEGDDPTENDGSSTDALTFWSGVDVGLSGYLTKDNEMNLPTSMDQWELDYSKSITVSLNFAEKKFRLIQNYVGLNTGLGLEFNNYAFKNDVSLFVSQDTVLSAFDTTRSYDKNKLKTTYLTMPLMLEFNTSKFADKSVHIAVGVVGGWRIGTKWKHAYETDEERVKNKVKSHYHLNPFKYSAALRVGYGRYTVFANYGLSSLFEENKGPELYPFNVGITLTGI